LGFETVHPGYDRYTPRAELDGAWKDLETRAARGMAIGDLYLELSRVSRSFQAPSSSARGV
ncbi:MAG: hypothetical protein AAFZ18_18755, partial [Myxococcota bacterium]